MNHITVLHNNGAAVMGDENLIKHVIEFYEDLFSHTKITRLGGECDRLSEGDREFITNLSLWRKLRRWCLISITINPWVQMDYLLSCIKCF